MNTAKTPVKGLEINKIEYEALLRRGFDVYLGDSDTFLKDVKNNSLMYLGTKQLFFIDITHIRPYPSKTIKISSIMARLQKYSYNLFFSL